MRDIVNAKKRNQGLITIIEPTPRHYHNYILIDKYQANFGKTLVGVTIKQCYCGKQTKCIRPVNKKRR